MSNPAYFFLEIDIHDHDAMKPYLEKAGATLAEFGATPVILNGPPAHLEGDAPLGNVVALRFDSMAQALAWYNSSSYREILPHRLNAATNRAYFVEGIAA